MDGRILRPICSIAAVDDSGGGGSDGDLASSTAKIDGREVTMNLSPAAGCLACGRYSSSDGFGGHGVCACKIVHYFFGNILGLDILFLP